MRNLSDLFTGQLQSGLVTDCLMFLPELILCAGIVLLLVLRMIRSVGRAQLGAISLIVVLCALVFTVLQWNPEWFNSLLPQALQSKGLLDFVPTPADNLLDQSRPMFGGLLIFDRLTIFLRLFLFGFSALIIWLTLLTGIPDREDSADFHTLLLGAVIGMTLMASANHLLMVYIGVEMASLPSYALAGFLKGRRSASEAALKYVVYGGGASGVMLFGISLVAGTFGTAYMPDLAAAVAMHVSPATGPVLVYDPLVLLGTLFVLIGIAFKLAAVPFHFWCPDVFEGASAEVAGFLSVASKGAALALLARVTLVFTGMDPLSGAVTTGVRWEGVKDYLIPVIGCAAAVTATFGNLAAYLQTNLKRLLAYSTIAHAGYMMMGLTPLTREGAAAVLFYLVGYLFMNLGAFAVVAFLRRETRSEDLADYRGLVRRSPWMVITLSVFLLSLLGIPPLVGFAAKFQVFWVLYRSGQAHMVSDQTGLGLFLYGLLLVGGLNTVVSAVYYVKVMKVMILDERVEDVEGREPTVLPERFPAVVFATVVALAVFLLGIVVNPVVAASQHGVDRFAPAGSPRVTLGGRKAAPPPLRPGAGRRGGVNQRQTND
jgi:NADH-quinone oxidoreductase subunit N